MRNRILEYLRVRPRATDTKLGVALFWVDSDPRDVEVALEQLVGMGLLVTQRRAGDVYYQLALRPARASGEDV